MKDAWVALSIAGALLVACATVRSDAPQRPIGATDPINMTVAVRAEIAEAKLGDGDDVERICPEALASAQIFRRVVYPARQTARPELAVVFRVVARRDEPDSLQNVKVLGTVLSGLLLTPVIRYRNTTVLTCELEVLDGPRPLRRYTARGSGIFDRARSILDTQILPRFGGLRLVGLRREEVERWQAERRETVSGSTANKELMRLGHLLNRAVTWGYLRASPARGIKRAKEAPGRARYLTPEERDKLLNGADVTVKAKDGRAWTTRREPNPALRLYILAALQTGARRGELAGLTWADVDMKARTVTFQQTKNGDARSVRMADTLREALQALPRPLDPGARVLPGREPAVLTRAFAWLCDDLKLVNLRFHDLRHDAASTLTMAGVPQRTVMAILGHRDPRMTMRYQHLTPEHLREAVRALDDATREALRPASSGTISAPASGA